jgi:hypothetical protein
MKKYIILAFLTLCIAISSLAQITISSPINRAVYQRNSSGTSGSATVTIAGQAPNVPCSANNYIRYRILNITLSTGSTISTYTNWTIMAVDARGRFFFNITPNTGWYQIDFELYLNNTLVTTNNTKFGVGDVYIIAGQSNAQGLSYGDASNQKPSTPQSGDVTYEAVVSCNYEEYCLMQGSKMPRFPTFSIIASGTSSLALGNKIAPTGHSNLYYTRLGNQLAASGVPVAFFNAAAQGSSIINWYESSFGNNTNAVFSAGTVFCNYGGSYVGSQAEPYSTFKKTLNYFASLFGIRAVLWHQGESDNNNSVYGHSTNMTSSTYQLNLEKVITQSRTDFGGAIPWLVSKVSYSKVNAPFLNIYQPVIDGQTLVIGNSNNNPVYLGAQTDQFLAGSRRADDGLHFDNNTNTTGLDGIRQAGGEWKNRLPLASGTPIAAIPMRNITVTKSGSSTFTLTAPAPPSGVTYTNYYWVANSDRLDNASFTTSSITLSGGTNYRCYLKRSDGKIEMTASGFTSTTCAANREAAIEEEPEGVNLKGYPNPATNDFTIEFEMPFDSDYTKLDLTNMTGEVVKVVAQGSFAKGHFTYPMVGKELPSGTYICRLLINDVTYSTKLVKLGQ